jgi:pyruvate/2-oxoglutarate dehydrogenase complex dihydrolipoamide dehydrogenase (E3) component
MDYDLIIIGGGSAGLTAAAGAKALGAKVAIIEKAKMGGDCLNYGCVPSKTLIKSSKVANYIKHADKYGLGPVRSSFKFSKVTARVQKVISSIAKHESPDYLRKQGIDVLLGSAKFINNHTLELKGKQITAKKFIICTGSRPLIPPIEGLIGSGFLTNEEVFDIKKQPKALAVVGGGPIGCELALAFARLGTKVTIVQRGERLLPRDDMDVSDFITKRFKEEGITILTKADTKKVTKNRTTKELIIDHNGTMKKLKVEEILMAVGRKVNKEGLGLDDIGVKTGKGIIVDKYLRTSVKNIYAAGDCAGPYLFTHMAGYQAAIALRNALFWGKSAINYSSVPWVTYLDPEIAHVGKSETELKKEGTDYILLSAEFSDVDRAICEGDTKGFVKVMVNKKGKILGATLVGTGVGEQLPLYTLAIKKGMNVGTLYGIIYSYPTMSEVSRKIGGQWYGRKLTPFRKKLLKGLFRLRGE